MTQRLSRIWNYFKKGRNEIGLILGLYSLLISYSIKFNVDFTWIQYLFFTIIFFIACLFLGIFLAEKVEPEGNRISPYAQDGLKSAIHLQQSLIYFYLGAIPQAIKEMEKAQNLRRKWLRSKF